MFSKFRIPKRDLGQLEDDDTEGVAIFHFDEGAEPEECSWLMHSGRENTLSDGDYWQSSRIDWNVAAVDHLKTLFIVAQHVAELLQWPASDASDPNADSVAEYEFRESQADR